MKNCFFPFTKLFSFDKFTTKNELVKKFMTRGRDPVAAQANFVHLEHLICMSKFDKENCWTFVGD